MGGDRRTRDAWRVQIGPLVAQLACVLCLMLAGCTGQQAAEGEDICNEAAQAVAQRTMACGGSIEDANARYAAVVNDFACIAVASDEPDLGCAPAIMGLTCDAVEASGDDLQRWLSLPACQGTFEPRPLGPSGENEEETTQ